MSNLVSFKSFLKENTLTPAEIQKLPRLSTKEAALELRNALKRLAPSTKFRVAMDRGSSIRVYWTDGPTEWQVKDFASQYQGRGFDGSTDSNYGIDSVITRSDGTKARAPFDFVFETRSYSAALLQKVLNYLDAKGFDWAKDVAIKTHGDGTAYFDAMQVFRNGGLGQRRSDGFDLHSIENTLHQTRYNMTGNGLIVKRK